MKPNEIRVMTDEQLIETIDELREERRQLRFDHAVGRLQNTRRIWHIRRDIARIYTIQTEREHELEIAAEIDELVRSDG